MVAEPGHHPVIIGAGTTLQPLDATLEYIRENSLRILPLYLVAMAPVSVAVFLLIDAVTGQHRTALPFYCLLLTIATIWRWGWLGALQRRIQEDVRGDPPLPLRSRLMPIILVRLVASFAMTWGGIVVLPTFYGFFVASFATPLLLEKKDRVFTRLGEAIRWTSNSAWRLSKILLALTMWALLVLMGVLVLQLFMIGTVLPEFLGIDAQSMSLTLDSSSWFLCMSYLLFLVVDLVWVVGSVMVFYDLQARRLGSDLRLRLRSLHEAGA